MSGDRQARLVEARDKLHAAIDGCESARELPGLVREYRMVLGELAALGGGEEVADVVDQLARRRQAKTAEGA